jgi:Putative phage integrase
MATTGTRFLEYLYTLETIPTGLAEIKASLHVHDRNGVNRTFRAHLEAIRQALPEAERENWHGNGHLYRLKNMFSILIEYNELKISNPIDVKSAKFQERPKRKRTVRSAIDPEMVEIIREFNSRDDFAFSRGIAKHYREVVAPGAEATESIWFPGYAIAIDVLLELPLRSHDARYMDTGEADEFIFDRNARIMVRNPSSKAKPGRGEGVVQYVTAKTSVKDQILGVHLAVNKTAPVEYEGRDIPYLPAELETNLLRMSDWVQKYVPLDEPVLAEKDSYLNDQRHDGVGQMIPRIFSVFRDPARRNGQPLSRELIYDYWAELCAGVEDQLNEGRSEKERIHLTKVEGDRRETVFDIHAMRITGVTNMLKRGLPPDLVQRVVGHASLIMTLYYRDISMREMELKLREYFAKRQGDREKLRELPPQELFDRLFNLENGELLKGVSGRGREYQRAWGPSWKLLSHSVCPGGDCSDGGTLKNGKHLPLRATACPLCRHRLTGPDFIPGLAANANMLMYQMRHEAKVLKGLQEQKYAIEEEGRPTHAIDGEIQQVRLRFEDCSVEWAAEVQYVLKATEMMESRTAKGVGDRGVLISAQPGPQLIAKLEERHEFRLLHSIATASEMLNWKPLGAEAAIRDNHELLDQVLRSIGSPTLLIHLPKELRITPANIIGELVTMFVPDSKLEDLALGKTPADQIVPPELVTMFKLIGAGLAHSAGGSGITDGNSLDHV